MSERSAAARYAQTGWPVFPCGPDKRPLTRNGYKGATTDPATIERWWHRSPNALIGTPTGTRFAVLDIDVRDDRNGFATLRSLGVERLPQTPTVRTPSGGFHLYFAQQDPPIRNTAGAHGRGIGPGLDWRGVGGYVILPAPETGYEWIDGTEALPLAEVPAPLLPRPAPPEIVGTPVVATELTAYGHAALLSATQKILNAPKGEQAVTLNGECYGIGRMVASGGAPPELALEVLLTAARQIPSYDPRRPWRPREIEATVRRAFEHGRARPRPTFADILAEMDREMVEIDRETANV